MNIDRVAQDLAQAAGTPGKASIMLADMVAAMKSDISAETIAELGQVVERLDEMSKTESAPGMSDVELASWFRLRGVREVDISALVDQFRGKTEDEMDEIYSGMHGSIG